MSNLLSVMVLCGGQSTEHEISLLSAKNVIERLDPKKYKISVVKITPDGQWCYFENAAKFLVDANTNLRVTIIPGQKNPFYVDNHPLNIDCIFPITHGTHGEDGTLQGLLDLLQIPSVGADCLGSAIAMDKEVTKRLLRDAGIPVVDWLVLKKSDLSRMHYSEVVKELGSMIFVKPNSLGSSVGTKKVTDEHHFQQALTHAFLFDEYVLIERAITGREIECSVIGNENPRTSLPGEIINHTEFYSYDAKYLDDNAATVKTPADLSPDLVSQFQSLALQTYSVLRCNGMARVDFFLDQNNKIYINEINTIPGFTNISMYPKNWEASGLSYTALLDQLIAFAMARFALKKSLIRVYQSTESSVIQ